MAYERRDFEGAAVTTTLAATITSGATSFTIVASTGWPDGSAGDFFARIENETIRCASRSGTTVTVASSGRGADGTTAAAHTSGVAVSHVGTKTDLDEANYAVSQTVGTVAAKGDLLVATGANVLDNLAVGSDDQVLYADSGEATGLRWDAVNPATPWTTYSPNVANFTLGNGTKTASYIRYGNTVHYKGKITLGSTSAVGSAPKIDLPVTAAEAIDSGLVWFYDSSTDRVTVGVCFPWSGSGLASLFLEYTTTGAGDSQVGTNNPFTWATSDELTWNITYEAA